LQEQVVQPPDDEEEHFAGKMVAELLTIKDPAQTTTD
jgi:hypothetical protein